MFIYLIDINNITICGCGIILSQNSNVQFGNHIMDSFEFESGRVLENVQVEYVTSGIPKVDDDGNIVNAVIYCPTLDGGHAILPQYHKFIQGTEFQRDKYFLLEFFIRDSGSCSPSTTGLKYNFPNYTFKDRVDFKRQFLSEKFKIKKILGIIGEGIGGYEVFTWACEYCDEMEFIILLNSLLRYTVIVMLWLKVWSIL